ncbi:MAG: hypothetical protein GYA17_08600 [Chloroflexi bacterium]|nr:hypothetical protein [Chloroflexota bacterium]
MAYRTRLDARNQLYFLTGVTYQRRKWFATPDHARLLITILQNYQEYYRFHVHAYVVMPDHYHMVLETGPEKTLSQILHAFHSFTATEINRAGGGMVKERIWQPRCWDEIIPDEEMFWQKVAYTLANPWRAGLVAEPLEEYPYSNLRAWVDAEGEAFVLDLFAKYRRWLE